MQRRKTSVALLSVVSNSTLVLLKVIIGVIIGSVSVISEAIHSGVDLLAAIIALYAVKTSDLPADEDHPFGHGKIENISGTVEALLIFLAAGWIIFEATKKLMHPEPMESAGLGVGVMLISAAANIFVSKKLFKVGKETDSVALQADAWHLRTDVFTSAGVMLGLVIIWTGKALFPAVDLQWVDPVAAITVAGLIIKAAYDLTKQSARDLLDVSLPNHEIEWVCKHIASLENEIRGFHRLRTRKSGSKRFVQFHLLVDAGMSVDESHGLNDKIVLAIKQQYPNCHVDIHIEPCKGDCTESCTQGCILEESDRKLINSSFRA